MKTFKFLIAIPVLLFSNYIFAQVVDISVQVLQGFSAQAKLYLFSESDFQLVDSSFQKAPGTYTFKLNEGYKEGVYKIEVGKNINFNIVVSNEPRIDISTVVFAPEDSLKSLFSKENRVFWQYQAKKKQQRQQAWLLQSLLDYYPDTLAFHHSLKEELLNLNRTLYNFAKKLAHENPELLASRYIILDQRPVVTEGMAGEAVTMYMRENWWNLIDLFDMRLLNTPALQSSLWSYIEQFFSDDYHKEEQDDAFIDGVSKLMCMEMNEEIRSFFRKTLIAGFTDSDYYPVVEFLETSKFGSLKPIKKSTSPALFNKLKPKTRVGEKAFDFTYQSPNGQNQKLSELGAEYILVLFWSSWCPHCIESLPRITEVYNRYKDQGFEVIAISIDEEENLWRRYVNDLGLNWVNIREPISQPSKMLLMYDVNETPKMFLLSKDLTIVSRPATRRQLENRLRRLF